ncbi:unnamed protein product [Calypogeia fissa]
MAASMAATSLVHPQMLHIRAGPVVRHHQQLGSSSTRVYGLATAPLHPRRILRCGQVQSRSLKISCSAAGGAASNPPAGSDESPYQVLGVTPFEKFDNIKAVYTRRHRDAEKRGDEAAMARLEGAYDQLLMAQLRNRKQGRTVGDFEVSKEIKYADKRAWFPWGPKSAVSSRNDILINFAGSAAIGIWMYVLQQADWKPLQFLLFGYVWRIFMKLADFEPPASAQSSFAEDDEEQTTTRRQKTGKRLLRTLAFVFGCVAIASVAFTGMLNGYELLGLYIPRAVINSQELFVTVTASVLLFIVGSYFR